MGVEGTGVGVGVGVGAGVGVEVGVGASVGVGVGSSEPQAERDSIMNRAGMSPSNATLRPLSIPVIIFTPLLLKS